MARLVVARLVTLIANWSVYLQLTDCQSNPEFLIILVLSFIRSATF